MKLPTYFRPHWHNLTRRRRDPRYIFVLIIATLVFTICYLQVLSAGLFDSIERPVFDYFNALPHSLHSLMFVFTQFGGLGSLIVWMGVAWYFINKRAAFTVFVTGFTAWALAKVAKASAHRGRPQDVLHNIHLFTGETFHGYGFPSGHAAFSAACATVLYFQIAPRFRKYLLLVVLAVGISRMYLGAHFPLDVVGGWALGAMIGAGFSLIFGMSSKGISARKLKTFLNSKGYDIQSLRFANVDARGSRPVFITTSDGREYFGKIFGRQEHAADWLYKIFRFFRYKNLQAEEPYINSKRNVEIESFAMLWARQQGIRVARVISMFPYGTSWIAIQDRLNATPLSEQGRILQRSLEDAWRQVRKLHDANMAHRDLRAANVMIDKQGQAWIIDFGFAEVAASKQRQYMDIAELLMSMALVAGVKRTVAAALKATPKDRLTHALPYLQKAVFSGATTKALKQDKPLLNELKDSLTAELHIKKDVEEATIERLNGRKALNLTLIAIFVYLIAPQFSSFRHAFLATHISTPSWLIPLAIASLATYLITAVIYVILANVPLKIFQATLVQLAASFVSKILPGGVGSTGLNARYLQRAGMDAIEVSTVITTQSVLGFILFIVPLGLFLLLHGDNLFTLMHFHIRAVWLLVALVSITFAGALIYVIPKWRTTIIEKTMAVFESMRDISTRPRELALAGSASFGVTVAYIACLYAALHAVGISLGIASTVLVYATAVIAKSAIPTPGGLGPVEAAMIATLFSLGISKDDAFSAVLVYRLATFWVPVPFSLLAYRYISNRKLI